MRSEKQRLVAECGWEGPDLHIIYKDGEHVVYIGAEVIATSRDRPDARFLVSIPMEKAK